MNIIDIIEDDDEKYIFLSEIFLQKELFLLCCSLGEQFMGHTEPPANKLFLFEPFYFNHVE